MKRIELTRGEYAIVDDEDFEYLSQFFWSLGKRGYAVRNPVLGRRRKAGDPSSVSMHREIMQAPKGVWVDHINHDPLDNRKENLRFCTPRQSNANVRPRASKKDSKYKGVFRKCGKGKPWRAQLGILGNQRYLGVFDTQEEAALAYNKAAAEYFGEFAYLNDVNSSHL